MPISFGKSKEEDVVSLIAGEEVRSRGRGPEGPAAEEGRQPEPPHAARRRPDPGRQEAGGRGAAPAPRRPVRARRLRRQGGLGPQESPEGGPGPQGRRGTPGPPDRGEAARGGGGPAAIRGDDRDRGSRRPGAGRGRRPVARDRLRVDGARLRSGGHTAAGRAGSPAPAGGARPRAGPGPRAAVARRDVAGGLAARLAAPSRRTAAPGPRGADPRRGDRGLRPPVRGRGGGGRGHRRAARAVEVVGEARPPSRCRRGSSRTS